MERLAKEQGGGQVMVSYGDDRKPTPGAVGTHTVIRIDSEWSAVTLAADCHKNGWPMTEQLRTVRDLMLAGF